jgi:hypothetical protein
MGSSCGGALTGRVWALNSWLLWLTTFKRGVFQRRGHPAPPLQLTARQRRAGQVSRAAAGART